MGSKREKYPEKCPWDLGPNQHLAKEENWTLRLGEANVCFSKNKLDNNYFHVISNENEEQILAFRADSYIKNYLIKDLDWLNKKPNLISINPRKQTFAFLLLDFGLNI